MTDEATDPRDQAAELRAEADALDSESAATRQQALKRLRTSPNDTDTKMEFLSQHADSGRDAERIGAISFHLRNTANGLDDAADLDDLSLLIATLQCDDAKERLAAVNTARNLQRTQTKLLNEAHEALQQSWVCFDESREHGDEAARLYDDGAEEESDRLHNLSETLLSDHYRFEDEAADKFDAAEEIKWQIYDLTSGLDEPPDWTEPSPHEQAYKQTRLAEAEARKSKADLAQFKKLAAAALVVLILIAHGLAARGDGICGDHLSKADQQACSDAVGNRLGPYD